MEAHHDSLRYKATGLVAGRRRLRRAVRRSRLCAELPALTPAQLNLLDDRNLLVKHTGQEQVNGGRRLPQRLDLDGARAVVFERRTTEQGLERVVVFLGTQPTDRRNNSLEYLGHSFTGNQENLQAYVQAQPFTKGQMVMAERDGARISFSGCSRGSLLSTAMSGVFDRPSIAFNGAPLAKGLAHLNPRRAATGRRQGTVRRQLGVN
jgi:hypothetical protein